MVLPDSLPSNLEMSGGAAFEGMRAAAVLVAPAAVLVTPAAVLVAPASQCDGPRGGGYRGGWGPLVLPKLPDPPHEVPALALQ